ncbi:hypothetical protein C8J56DRAFT_1169013 [Mycena floridula]|nr:hypothetical protein C8J56DRAFT_1169013 [Mycena floridula]
MLGSPPTTTSSLPTPPRTQRKRKAGKAARDFSDSDSDEERKNNRKRVRKQKAQEDEDVFWTGTSTLLSSGTLTASSSSSSTATLNSDPESPIRRERAASAFASPPPSHRKTATSSLDWGSPDNPFLNSPTRDDKPAKEPAAHREKPTVTYVHRGVRRVLPNPFYDSERGRTVSPPPNSDLPPEHPDYEPDLRLVPRNLFPSLKEKL